MPHYYLFLIELRERIGPADLETMQRILGLNFRTANAYTMQAGFEVDDGVATAMGYLAKLIESSWPNVRSAGIYR